MNYFICFLIAVSTLFVIMDYFARAKRYKENETKKSETYGKIKEAIKAELKEELKQEITEELIKKLVVYNNN